MLPVALPPPAIVPPTTPAAIPLAANPAMVFTPIPFVTARTGGWDHPARPDASDVSTAPAAAPVVSFTSSAWIRPATCNWAAGDAVPMPTPPVARIRNWFGAVESKKAAVEESPQTNVPSFVARAPRPAAKLNWPPARLKMPPGTTAKLLVARLPEPPMITAPLPETMLSEPPPMNAFAA